MAVDTNHQVFSSDYTLGGITIARRQAEHRPAADVHRHGPAASTTCSARSVSPAVVAAGAGSAWRRSSASAPARSSTSLPIGEEFDWVDLVSIELTTMTLATLFDFPFEDRRKLTRLVGRRDRRAEPGGLVETLRAEDRAIFGEYQRLFRRACGTSGSTPRRQGDLISMLAHNPATRNMDAARVFRQRRAADRRRQRHDAQHDLGLRARAQPEPGSVRQAARQPGADPLDGVGDHPLADAARPHAPHGDRGHRVRRQDDPQGRQGRHVVRLGQPRRRGDRAARTTTSSTASARASTSRSASASTAASATAWPSCSCTIIWEEILKRFPEIERRRRAEAHATRPS